MAYKNNIQYLTIGINKRKNQKKDYKLTNIPLRHVPEEIANIKLNCPFCKERFKPNWIEKHSFPLKPIKPRWENGQEYNGLKRWVLKTTVQKCPSCNTSVSIEVPKHEVKASGSLFGDDASRDFENKSVFIYTLLGADKKFLPDLESKLKKLKQNLLPSIHPDEWKIHMKDMWSGSNRKRHKYFKFLTFDEIKDFVDKILNLIRKNNLFIYNIAATCPQKAPKKERQLLCNESYTLIVMNAIDEWTNKSAQPYIYFDSEKDSNADEIIHGLAKNLFYNSQHSLLYAFLSKGIEIPEPKFVKPASYPELELADFISYTIARFHLRMWQGKSIEIDPKHLGLATYLGYDKIGNLLCCRRVGYPWKEFHQIDPSILYKSPSYG